MSAKDFPLFKKDLCLLTDVPTDMVSFVSK